MSNSYFQFKQFTVHQQYAAMKVTTDSCLFGAWIANDLAKDNQPKTLLDIGTGTGLLSLMVAQKNKAVAIDAIEIDKQTSNEAIENINQSPWKKNINVINHDIRNFTPAGKYDSIVCNPPFYENELQSDNQQKNTAHHSTDLTLNFLCGYIKLFLKESGHFYLLLPGKRSKHVEDFIAKNELTLNERIRVRQTVNHNFFRIIIKGQLKNISEEKVTEISIKNDNHHYTNEFTELLKDYYLYL